MQKHAHTIAKVINLSLTAQFFYLFKRQLHSQV